MKKKKWLILFLSLIASFLLLWMTLNIVVDPFGVFGDFFFEWDDYNITQNPKVAKLEYVSDNIDKFDSYIIGSSVAAAFDVDLLNEYTDSEFYNMYHNDNDTDYDKNLVSYLIKEDDVKNIFLVLGLQDADSQTRSLDTHYKTGKRSAFSFYLNYFFADYRFALDKINCFKINTQLPQYFDNINHKTGSLNTCVYDVTPSEQKDFIVPTVQKPLNDIKKCIENVKSIAEICKQNNVNLTVVIAPASEGLALSYKKDSINDFYMQLSSVVDFWDFSLSGVSYDIQYFYDAYNIRSDTCNMVLSRIFDDKDIYYPSDFGVYYSNNTYPTVKTEYAKITDKINIPIFMLHHFDEKGEGSAVLSYDKFEHVLSFLKQNEYNTVTFDDLINYVKYGKKLPDNSVVLTFDDGYSSNYNFVFPMLKKYNYKATIFVIGDSVGDSKYKDTSKDIIPHFNKDELIEMSNSGYVDIYSHTYDMHQSSQIETTENIRTNIKPFKDESEIDYVNALNYDVKKQNELFQSYGLKRPNVLAFPGGKYESVSNEVLRFNGIEATITTNEEKVNTLVCGQSQSLVNLGRLNIAEYTTDEQILDYLKK